MTIYCFDDLLRLTRQQQQPQRLLFVFVTADLPEESTPTQRERFLAGLGGALVPVMCVDKAPDELQDFVDIVQESRQFGVAWSIVFIAAMSGSGGLAPTSEASEKTLQRMVESIKAGTFGVMIPFDRQGQSVVLG